MVGLDSWENYMLSLISILRVILRYFSETESSISGLSILHSTKSNTDFSKARLSRAFEKSVLDFVESRSLENFQARTSLLSGCALSVAKGHQPER
jgi:hypothetical protein